MIDDNEKEGRLSRWSKRKLAVAEAEAPAAEGIEEVAILTTEEQTAAEAELQAELLANREAAEAVDLETLDEESDFSVFLKDGVPEMLKKKAMLTLWRTNPIFANVDGLVDYDDDFGSPDLIMKTFKSAYQAGRGYLEVIKKQAEATEASVAAAAADDGVAESEEEIAEIEEVDDPAADAEAEEEDLASGDVDEEVETDSEHTLIAEEEQLEEEVRPKISLRRRLELESQA